MKMPKPIDETGKRFNRLVVVKYIGQKRYGGEPKRMWLCKCDCGNTIITAITPLKQGRTKSCGCYANEMQHSIGRKHGMSNSRIFSIWANMLSRCTNPNSTHFKRYGGRGITVCDEWLGEEGSVNFINWALNNGYSDELTIDRINNDKGYSPDNCRWVTNKVQQRNKSTNKLLTLDGKTLCVSEWSEITGISTNTINQRLNRGWSVVDALTTPVKKSFSYKKGE